MDKLTLQDLDNKKDKTAQLLTRVISLPSLLASEFKKIDIKDQLIKEAINES